MGVLLQIGVFVGVVITILIGSYKRYSQHTKLRSLERLAGMGLALGMLLVVQWFCGMGEVMARGDESVELLYGRNGFLYTFTSDMATFFGGEEVVEVPEEVLQVLQQLLVEGQKKGKGSYTVGQVGMEEKVLVASDVFKVQGEK